MLPFLYVRTQCLNPTTGSHLVMHRNRPLGLWLASGTVWLSGWEHGFWSHTVCICTLAAVLPGTSYLTALCLSIPIYKMEVILVPNSYMGW